MPITEKTYLQINQALFSLTHAYEKRMVEEKDTRNLSLSDCSVLMVLHQFSPMTASQLSEIMEINPGTISTYVQRLMKKGLIERQQDTDDRRNWWLVFTKEGALIAEDVVKDAITYTSDFLSALNDNETRELQKLLLKASHSLGYTWQ